MKRVVDYIDSKIKAEMETHPFIKWLEPAPGESSEIAELKLKTWIPCMVYFAFGCKDFNHLVLKYSLQEASEDALKAAINEHSNEDGNHWPWLLMDLKTLDMNPNTDWVTMLKTLWGNQNVAQRQGIYDLMRIAYEAKNPLLRMVLICTFEKCGHIMTETTAKLGNLIEAETGKRLHYFGQTHLDHEEGDLHCKNSSNLDAMDEAWKKNLSDEDFEIAVGIVDQVIRSNKNRWNEFLGFVTK